MTRRELIISAINHQACRRVPYHIPLTVLGYEACGEQQEYDLIRAYGKNVFVHSCGKVDRIMDDLVEMGLEVLNPVQPECMELSGLKRDYGDKLTFFGGISTQRTLPYGTPEEVWKETEDTIRLMSVNGGYITAPSQEIQTDVPYENLRALIDAAREASR